MNVLSHEDQLCVLHMLCEGCSLRSITRLTGVHRTTTMKLMLSVGERCREFLDRRMRHLHLNHLEIDEIWTFVKKKQGRLSTAEAANTAIGDQYLFIALDQETKLIPSFLVGKRTGESTEMFLDDLSERIVAPPLNHPGPRPILSTDGFAAYPNAIDLVFANTVEHGVLIKDYQQVEQPGRYGPPQMVHATRITRTSGIDKWEICTSHVERHNLNIRTFMRRFTRLALGFSKKLENLAAAVSLYIAHYNFCRMHGSLPGTPAMSARVAGHPWTLEELLQAL